jgi:hypothetical protein
MTQYVANFSPLHVCRFQINGVVLRVYQVVDTPQGQALAYCGVEPTDSQAKQVICIGLTDGIKKAMHSKARLEEYISTQTKTNSLNMFICKLEDIKIRVSA